MTLFIDRVDAAPVLGSQFEYPFATWLSVLVNVLNENIQDIQGYFNLLQAQSYTSVQIAAMMTAGTLVNGVLLYDSTLDVYVGMQSGALVQFTTSAYP